MTDLYGFSAPLVSDNFLNLKTFGLTVISGSDVFLNHSSWWSDPEILPGGKVPQCVKVISCYGSNNQQEKKIVESSSYGFFSQWIDVTAGSRWMKPVRAHLCRILIQCSNAFVKVGAINRLISNTMENIVIRGEGLSETQLSTLFKSGSEIHVFLWPFF